MTRCTFCEGAGFWKVSNDPDEIAYCTFCEGSGRRNDDDDDDTN